MRGLPAEIRTAVFVGHNDGLEQLASDLSGVTVVLKTSTYALLESRVPWPQWQRGQAELREVVVAR